MPRSSVPAGRDIRTRGTDEGPFTLRSDTPKPKPKPSYHKEPRLTKREKKELARASYESCPPSEDETWFRHTHWENKRKLVRTALKAAGTGPRQMEAFDYCGAQCIVEFCPAENKYRIRGDYCRCRHCAPCALAKQNLLAANLRKRLEEKPKGGYRFATLTLKHSNTPLPDQIKRLYKSWRKLRNTKLWKTSATGGLAILEVKWQQQTRMWHPHLHIIYEGGFIPQKSLSAEWFAITGDSYIVDIRALSSAKDAAHYLSKYVGKGTNNEVWHDPEAAIQWVVAMRGVRTAATFGKWRGFKLLGHDADERHWVKIASLNSLVSAAQDKEEWAILTLRHLCDELQYNPHKPRGKKHAGEDEPPS